jgi:hypothetical protein
LLVVERCRISGTCGGRLSSVETERDIPGMHIVAEGFHAAGKAGDVGR